MVVNALRTHSRTSLNIQPEHFKLSLQSYLYVYIMFCLDIFTLKFCLDILMLKYVELLANVVY